jgi:HEAT repeat protein
MRKHTSFEVAYAELSRLGRGPMNDEAVSALRTALTGRSGVLVSMAADIAAGWGLGELVPEMIAAFERFMIDGGRVDKQCHAKIGIVNALNKMEYMGDEVFMSGAHCVQMEPSFGPPIDAAVEVRSGCAYGLARIDHPDALFVLTDLLVDGEHHVRIAAAKALGYLGRPESEYLLRFRVLAGDPEPDVIRECFEALIGMAPDRSLDFVTRYLRSNNAAIVQYAALAIGSSRMAQAYDKLRECWEDNPSPTARRMLLLPIALVRSDEAFEFLLDVVRTSEVKTAVEAVTALSMYTSEDSVRKIGEVVKKRGDADVMSVFRRELGVSGH